MTRPIKIVISLFVFLALLFGSGFFVHQSVVAWRWDRAARAAGGFPYQIGLTGAVVVNCVVACNGGCCTGGALCTVKAPGICASYATVSGAPAGGMGNMALFSMMAIGAAGLTSGGQLIAGGMTMTEMDSGVLASTGGCYGSGCASLKPEKKDRIFAWLDKLDKYIIAGFKGSQK